jgi:hypothetical protein
MFGRTRSGRFPRFLAGELRRCPEAKAIGAVNDDGAFGNASLKN